MPTRRLQSFRAELALVLVAFVWGSTFVLVKSALDDISTLLYLALRFSLAGIVLAVAYRRHFVGLFADQRCQARGGVLAGVCLIGGYMFQTSGLRYTTASKSAFLTGLAIVLVPLLNSLVYRVAPKASEGAGILIAAVGMGLMTLEGPDLGLNPGDLLTLAGAVFFAAHFVVLGHYAPRQGFQRISVLQVVTAAGLALGACWWLEEPRIEWNATVLLALGVTGLLATAVAFTILAWAQQHTTPTRTAVIIAIEPVFAAATSAVVLGELLSRRAMAGGLLILAGILLVELKPRAKQ